VEIERLDEADAVVVSHEQADDQGVATPETRDQQAYRAEYRATVEAAYTWDGPHWNCAKCGKRTKRNGRPRKTSAMMATAA
jgi:hypothetical protein